MAIWSGEIKEVEKLHDSIKGQFPDLDKELEQLIKTEDANVVMLYSRRCLEVIITDLCENELKRPRKTEPLKGIIDKLNKEERVPLHIITSMDHLNSLATYGTHPKDFDPEQIKPVLNNLSTVLKWYLKYKENLTISKIKSEEEKTHIREPLEEIKKEDEWKYQVKPAKVPSQRLLSGIFIIAILIIVIALYAYPKLFKQNPLDDLRSSRERITVAVLPFQNITNDTTLNVWQYCVQDNLVSSLSNFDELQVRRTESVNTLFFSKGVNNSSSITPLAVNSLLKKLNVNILIYGNIQKAEQTIRVSATLIDSKTESVLKSFEVNGSYKEKTFFEMNDSLRKMVTDFLVISKLIKDASPYLKPIQSFSSPLAWSYFVRGQNSFEKYDLTNAIYWWSEAVKLDSNWIMPNAGLTYAYRAQNAIGEAKKICNRLYKEREQMPERARIYASCLYALYFETPLEAIKYLKQDLEIDDQFPLTYYNLGDQYNQMHQYDKAILEFERALNIFEKWGIRPAISTMYTYLGIAYHKTGKYKKEEKLYKKAESDFPNDPNIIYRQAILALTLGEITSANRYIEKYISIQKENAAPEAEINTSLGNIYSESNNYDRAEEHFRLALSDEPTNPVRINNLAYFLIDKDRNVIEGLGLAETILKSNPNNYYYLHTKGWGLYMQGKYQDALDILQNSWDIRIKEAIYDHEAFLHLEAAKKAVANQK
jgi:tetratricopeptide (TPR) repeat protein